LSPTYHILRIYFRFIEKSVVIRQRFFSSIETPLFLVSPDGSENPFYPVSFKKRDRIKRLHRTAGELLIRRTKVGAPKKNGIFADGLISKSFTLLIKNIDESIRISRSRRSIHRNG
jgi:hypothetical protein